MKPMGDPVEGSSGQTPLPRGAHSSFSHTGGTSSQAQNAGEITIDIRSDDGIQPPSTEQDAQEQGSSVSQPKHRPLDLTDEYELVRGIPAKVWQREEGFESEVWTYAFSSDGTRMAIKTHTREISVYDATDNYSLIAVAKNIGEKKVIALGFWKNCSDKLVVCYDGKIGLFSISLDSSSQESEHQTQTNQLGVGHLRKEQEYEAIGEFPDVSNLRFHVSSFGSSTWIFGWDTSKDSEIYIHLLERETEESLKRKNLGDTTLMPSFLFVDDDQKSLMSVATFFEPEKNKTRLWKNIDFYEQSREDNSYEIDGRSFGFTKDGQYCVVWVVTKDTNDHLLKLYKISAPESGQIELWKEGTLITGILDVSAVYLEDEDALREAELKSADENFPLIAFITIRKNRTTFVVFNFDRNEKVKEFDLTVRVGQHPYKPNVELHISPNMEWIVVGCWNSGTIGLFSFRMGAVVWNNRFPCQLRWNPRISHVRFDNSGSRLIINADEKMYALAASCLCKQYQVDFECVQYNVDYRPKEKSIFALDTKHLKLLSKEIVWEILRLREGPLEKAGALKKLCVTISKTSLNVALLVRDGEHLCVLFGSFQSVTLSWYKRSKLDDREDDQCFDNLKEIKIERNSHMIDTDEARCNYWIFLYSSKDSNKDESSESIAIVYIKNDSVVGLFLSSDESRSQDVEEFAHKADMLLQQESRSEFRHIITSRGVMIIDLIRREYQIVQYTINLKNLICKQKKKSWAPNVSSDGTSLLYGCNKENKGIITLTPTTSQQDLNEISSEKHCFRKCYALGENCRIKIMLESDEELGKISSIIAYNSHNGMIKEYIRDDWSSQMSQIIDIVAKSPLYVYDFKFDETNGCIWMIILQLRKKVDKRLYFIPIGPYSIGHCLPSLGMLGYPKQKLDKTNITKLTSNYGISFISMPFNGTTNLKLAFERKDRDLLLLFLDIAARTGNLADDIWSQYLKNDEEGKVTPDIIANEKLMKIFIDFIEKKCIEFEDCATIINKNLNQFWSEYRLQIIALLSQNMLEWDIGTIDCPSEVLNNKSYSKLCVGTSNSILEWKKSYVDERLYEYWKEDKKDLLKSEENRSPWKEKATLKFFCMKDACKLGRHGLLRFLLINEAPSFVYKTKLVKYVIAWKWHYIWENRYKKEIFFYILCCILFCTCAISIGYIEYDCQSTTWARIFLSSALFFIALYSSRMLHKEYVKLRSYMKDKTTLQQLMKDSNSKRDIRFGNKPLLLECCWGMRKYLKSIWNMIAVISHILLIVIFVLVFFQCSVGLDARKYFIWIISFEVLLMCTKFWYFAQAGRRMGALVLLIENVVKDCIYFLLLAGVVMVGFSFGLFLLFRYNFNDNHDNDEAISRKINDSFGSPLCAVQTLFYAMLGTFEPEVYNSSGSLKILITTMFITYLAVQMVIMLNMLIAIMGDTFDRVKNKEKEHFLMARARYIDASEATLTHKKAMKIQEGIQPYLYALIPVEKNKDIKDNEWKGREKTVEKRIKHDIKDSNRDLIEKIENSSQAMTSRIEDSTQANATQNEKILAEQENMKHKLHEVQRVTEEKFEQILVMINQLASSLRTTND